MNNVMKKCAKVLVALVATGVLSGLSVPEAEAQATCEFGFTRRATRLQGGSTYATPCRIDSCIPWGVIAEESYQICWLGACSTIYTYKYRADPGSTPTTSCRSEVSDDFYNIVY